MRPQLTARQTKAKLRYRDPRIVRYLAAVFSGVVFFTVLVSLVVTESRPARH